jgi:hypothetical protein
MNATTDGLAALSASALTDERPVYPAGGPTEKETNSQVITLIENTPLTIVQQWVFQGGAEMGLFLGQLGGSGAYAKMWQLGDLINDVTNATNVETILMQWQIGTNVFGTNGDKVWAELHGITAAHASNTRQFRVYFGALGYDSTAQATIAAASWTLIMKLIRNSLVTPTTGQVRCAVNFYNKASLAAFVENNVIKVANLALGTAPMFLTVTGTSSNSGVNTDITAEMGSGEWKSAA